MEKDEIMTFQIINDKGEKIECEILFTFSSDETKKNYMIYTDNTVSPDGDTNVYASIYEEVEGEETKLSPIETEKEWKIIETILQKLQEEASNQ